MNTKNITIICVTLILIGVIFWPTLYRYDKMTGGGYVFLIRTNRLTGYTEYFQGKWIPQEEQQNIKKSESLPLEEQIKVIGGKAELNRGYTDGPYFKAELYNGSSWTITDVIIRVVVKAKLNKELFNALKKYIKEDNGKKVDITGQSVRWDRKFEASCMISSLSTGSIYINVIDIEDLTSWFWDIVEIRGYKED